MAVGNVSSMILKTTDTSGNAAETTITNQRLFVNSESSYQQVDSLARALVGLTNNTYEDTNLITVVSVKEKLAE